jgi:DNA repair exonuclease SbcCD nuclease subunit
MTIQVMDQKGASPQSIIFVSDMHLSSAQPIARTDDAHATCVKKFRWLLQAAIKHNAVVVQAGDLFDSSRDWQMLHDITMALREFAVPFFTVYGQHDMYMRSKAARPYTAMGQLAAAGLVTVLGTVPLVAEGWALYGCSYGDQPPAPEPGDMKNILVRHAPVHTEPLFDGHEYIDAAETLKQLDGYQHILCGDIHRSFMVEGKGHRVIFNTGPFFRRDASKYNFTHVPTFVVMAVGGPGAGQLKWLEAPCEPAEQVLSREHIQEAEARKVLSEFIEAIHVHGPLVNVSIVDRVRDALEAPDVPQDIKDLMQEVMDYVGG